MSATRIYIGQRVRLTARFTDTASGVLTDPSTVTCTVKAPDGTLITPTTSSSATGIYVAELVVEQGGRYRVQIVGSGAGMDTAIQDAFDVERSNV